MSPIHFFTLYLAFLEAMYAPNLSAASNASGLLPPASARSARPPPLPPTCAATKPTIP